MPALEQGKSNTGCAETTRARWLVSGRVQGVGFRFFVVQRAGELGVRGDVRNLPDGRVEIRAEAERARLQSFLRIVEQGPRWARVESVEQAALGEELGWTDFRIRR